ncbi:MAG: metal ABC transporter permease [Oceanobacter sp.]
MEFSWWMLPLIGGLLLSLVTGPLGCFVVWRRMAFFGDTLAHGSLLGITLGILLDVSPTLALMMSSGLLALLLFPIQRSQRLSSDTLLGIISHSMLAVGLVALSLADGIRVDLMSYLFGDLLALGPEDLLWIVAVGSGCLLLIALNWRGLLATTVSQELARIDGYPVARLNLLLVVILALVVAMAMKIVGILLVSALLIIPPAAARNWVRTPLQMALLAALLGGGAVLAGMAASFYWDTPAGPSIVVAAASLFLLGLLRRTPVS